MTGVVESIYGCRPAQPFMGKHICSRVFAFLQVARPEIMTIPMDTAALLGLFLDTLLYGVFFTLYCFTLIILLKKTGIKRQLLLPVATLLLCIATAHLIIDFVRALDAFIFKVDTIGASDYYSNFSSPLFVASTALLITQTILADAIVVWRCYMLNDRSLFVAIPGCIMLLASMATGYYGIGSLSLAHPLSNVTPADYGCIATFDALTMVLSVASTSLNAWRIYRTRSFMPEGSAVFLPVFVVIIESGAFYSTSIFVLLLTFFIGSNGQYTMLDIITPIVGITFCLIILQVHFNVGGNLPAENPMKPGVLSQAFRESEV
ncbi:uncharacterized protein EDB93DRAFT_1127383 [Suillus bovinus]|uniref:uncharacterized protein n=1 Tax=Suillus bovinus TaxID=48563 RepID=UPI001B871D5F|nr:uncharacterized protein EDB93DRAFT_1127383 [Suillus bovinus]KAG2156581.1 hypothetical protein EDB93DRAFT_1127383 [Suillus bovinus]